MRINLNFLILFCKTFQYSISVHFLNNRLESHHVYVEYIETHWVHWIHRIHWVHRKIELNLNWIHQTLLSSLKDQSFNHYLYSYSHFVIILHKWKFKCYVQRTVILSITREKGRLAWRMYDLVAASISHLWRQFLANVLRKSECCPADKHSLGSLPDYASNNSWQPRSLREQWRLSPEGDPVAAQRREFVRMRERVLWTRAQSQARIKMHWKWTNFWSPCIMFTLSIYINLSYKFIIYN